MVEYETLANELPTELVAVAVARPRSAWRNIGDDELQIPQQLVETVAYFRYIDRGQVQGHHRDDYFNALAQLRAQLREFIEFLEQAPPDEIDGVLEEVNGAPSEFPKDVDEQEAHSVGVVQNGGGQVKDQNDRYGNLWTSDRPLRSSLTHAAFLERFGEYQVVLIEVETDRIFAAGVDEGALESGLAERNLEASCFQIEPGPFSIRVESPRRSNAQ